MTLFGVRWRLHRSAEPPRGWREAFVLFAVYLAMLAAGVFLCRSVENSTVFWAPNGVLVAGLLLLRPRIGWSFLAACVAVNAGLNVWQGLPPNLNVSYTLMNAVLSVAVAVLTRTFCGAALDLGRLRRFLPFVALVGAAAMVEGAIGATIAAPSLTNMNWDLWLVNARRWATCDALGIILALPMTLMLMRRSNPLYGGAARWGERIALLGGMATLTALTFAFAHAPLVMLLYPVVLFAAFRLGTAWSFLGVMIVAQIATTMTLHGYGPIAVFDVAGPFNEVGMIHPFLASILLTASLATSAWAERMRTEQRAGRKAASAAAARARTDQMAATRERFLAVVSHEIRTPLNGVAGYAGALAARSDLAPEARRQAEQIGVSTAVLTGLIEDILDFSRLETGRLELEPTSIAVGTVISEAVERSRGCALAKGLDLTVTVLGDAAPAHTVDARRLRQVVAALVDNAVKFTEAGSVEVSAEWTPGEAGDRLSLSVQDTGAGVPEARRKELFQPFAQMNAGLDRRQSGAGLGLAMCRAIVELMGGTITYRAREGGGSIFALTLDLPHGEPQVEAAPVDGERAPRVLVVDDHPTNREVARLILAAYGCEIVEAEDGQGAVDAAAAAYFDVILMDVRMPGMDGLEATRAIRATGQGMPILAVTADVMREDVERCRASGMNGHVPKPINPARLMTAMMTVMDGGEAFPPVRDETRAAA